MEYMGKEKILSYIVKDRKKAFNTIVEEFSDKILKISYLELNDLNHSEEVVQEVLIKIYKSLDNFKGDSSIYTWIYKITINTCKSYKIKNKSFLSLDYLDNLNVESFEEEVIEDIGRFDLLELLNKLDYKYRRVLYLYYYEDFKIKEISEILKTKEETIKTWLRRGKIYLKKELLKNGSEEYFG